MAAAVFLVLGAREFGPQRPPHARREQTDLVLLPGDLSMARNHRDLQPDLAWLDRLPGTKVLAAGTTIPPANTPVLAPGQRYNGSPVYLSEFGGIAFIPPGHQVPGDAWGYSGVEKTSEAAIERLRGLYTAIARIPAFAGICYTQLTDVEQEINGLLTNDRKPKFDAKALREMNDSLR